MSIEAGQEDHDGNEVGACSTPRFCYEIYIRRKPDIRQSQSDYRMLPGRGEDSETKRSGDELSPDIVEGEL